MPVKSPYTRSFKPIALTIAGYDPSGGAGVLADIKTFEAMGIYGLAIITGNTHQNDVSFKGVTWLDRKDKEKNMALLAERFPVKAVKLGMHKDLQDVAYSIELSQKYFPDIKIIWDPVLAASAGFDLNIKIGKNSLSNILSKLELITPNQQEAEKLGMSKNVNEAASVLSKECPVLLKGGHSSDKNNSVDYLFINGENKKEYSTARIKGIEKHGSGCVLSAAIAASLANGDNLEQAIDKGKKYVTQFLKSNKTLLGYHLN